LRFPDIAKKKTNVYSLIVQATNIIKQESILMMKRQKRDRQDRAYSRGYQAGVLGRSKELCPYQGVEVRSEWLGGWREAISDKQQGLIK